MTLNAMCLDDRPDAYTGKKGLVKTQVATLVDMSDGSRLTHTLQYTLSDEEKERYAGKLRGRNVQLSIHEFTNFGGQIRCRGKLVNVDGEPKAK